MIKNLYLASDVRAGSSYAAELIVYNFHQRTGEWLRGLWREPLQALDRSVTAAQTHAILTGIEVSAGIRPAMIKCGQFLQFEWLLPEAPELTEMLFGAESYWLVLRRRDTLAQAVSLHCAMCSGMYHAYAEVPSCVPCRATDHDLSAALHMLDGSEDVLRRIERRAAHCLSVCYEDIRRDEGKFLDDVYRFVFAAEGDFAAAERAGVVLTPTHSRAKAALRERLARSLEPAGPPAVAEFGSGAAPA